MVKPLTAADEPGRGRVRGYGSATDLPWRLTPADLQRCLPDLGEPIIGAEVSHEIQGLHRTGGSCILTVYYRAGGHDRRRVLFLKITSRTGAEVQKYRYLATKRAPVAPMIGAVDSSDGEVLILDFLPRIGTTPEESNQLLDLIARLNAIDVPAADPFRPGPGDPDYGRQIQEALTVLLPRAVCEAGGPYRWFEAYQAASRLAADMSVALNHGELAFQQVGWTAPPASELVMFDLETMALLPRYVDIASVLAPLAARTGRSERELFDRYLRSFAQHAGGVPGRDTAWNSMLVVRIVRTFEALPWLWTMAGHPETEPPDEAVARLRRDLISVGLI